MIIKDFEYDGVLLSSKHYMVCTLGGNGLEPASNGSKINFTTVPIRKGIYNQFISSGYSECVTATFSICKDPCYNDDDMEISILEYNDLAAWLNRRNFHRLTFDDAQYTHINFDASFNLTRKEMNGKTYAIELEMITNRPHAYLDEVEYSNSGIFSNFTIDDSSNEEGFIYPKIELVATPDVAVGTTVKITNNKDSGNPIIIKNCRTGYTSIPDQSRTETITFDYPTITTTNPYHEDISNDFNWNFLKVVNKYGSKSNRISITPSGFNLKVRYNPILKIGL